MVRSRRSAGGVEEWQQVGIKRYDTVKYPTQFNSGTLPLNRPATISTTCVPAPCPPAPSQALDVGALLTQTVHQPIRVRLLPTSTSDYPQAGHPQSRSIPDHPATLFVALCGHGSRSLAGSCSIPFCVSAESPRVEFFTSGGVRGASTAGIP